MNFVHGEPKGCGLQALVLILLGDPSSKKFMGEGLTFTHASFAFCYNLYNRLEGLGEPTP